MNTLTYSPGLTTTVRSLKQLDSQQIAQLFKDTRWFEAFSLSAEEGKAVMMQLAKTSREYIKKSTPTDLWE
ncbi:hypothetical protein GC093_34910 [Paenibacillus sp. LMG 31456]|uniref:Uncharacterized protein n=1 Tax=Paenibacillus foliorum TaxID=2654974 RepID=A0A972GWW1_9BACL|nr:hypothetical protein [Paenibacillus foliorum]NOU98374.1 hypothetical protein [Paenibacillus foliorum]